MHLSAYRSLSYAPDVRPRVGCRSARATRKHEAPAFHYYLERHIHLDEDHHGPLSLLVLNELCEGDPVKLEEARQAAVRAICARMEFWDGVRDALAGRTFTRGRVVA